ncbi:MAG TPA: calcium-binding protein, partial [Gemmatimonadota bacterium]|nr:calcium-binding protein [Gemmatimonadota bacterium]
ASGTAEPLAELGVASHCGLTEQGVAADGDGDWASDYGGDFRHAAFVCTGGPADVAEPDVPGGGASPSRAVPIVSVDPSIDLVSADGFTPGEPVTFAIFQTPSSGPPLFEASRPTEVEFSSGDVRSPGHAELPAEDHGVPLETGMFVRATQGSTVKELTIAPFSIDLADPQADIVAGTAEVPPGGELITSVDLQLTEKPEVVDGAWEVDIAALPRPAGCPEPDCEWPYPWGLDSNVEASIVDAEGDRTELTEGAAELAEGVAGPGGTVTTDSEGDGATVEDPVETAVTTPTGGPVSIREEQQTQEAPSSFAFLGQQIDIDAPVETEGSPLEIEVRVDARRVPAGESAATLQIFRNGAFVPECAGAAGAATPSPCISGREDLSDGDVRLTMLSMQASEWNAGASNDARAPTLGAPSFSVDPKPQDETSILSATASDALTGVGGGEYFVGSDPGQGEAAAMLLDASTLTATVGTDLAPGTYDVGVRARDRAGNWSPVTTVELTVITGGSGSGSSPPPSPSPSPTASPSPTPTLSPPGDPLDAQCGDPGVVCGTDGDDELTGTDGADIFLGGEGNDSITGGGGNDTIVGGGGNDTLLGGDGDDTLLGGDGDDTCDGGDGDDTIDCSAGNDLLLGGSGNDDLRSTAGADRIAGQAGNDTISGGAGGDVLRGGAGADAIFGRSGADRLSGGVGRDYLGGGGEGDALNGGDGRDRMFGMGGSDVLLARDGFADGLNGGPGRDRARTDRLDSVRSIP